MPASAGGPGLQDEHLFAVYAAATAPYNSETLVNDVADLDDSDYTVSAAIDELRYGAELTAQSAAAIEAALASVPAVSAVHSGAQVADPESQEQLALFLLASEGVARRLSAFFNSVATFCARARKEAGVDSAATSGLVTAFDNAAAQGQRPPQAVLSSLDFTPYTPWKKLETPPPAGAGGAAKGGARGPGGVNFDRVTAHFDDGRVEHRPIDAAAPAAPANPAPRRRGRAPTGFAKFNFKDLGLDEGDLLAAEKDDAADAAAAAAAAGAAAALTAKMVSGRGGSPSPTASPTTTTTATASPGAAGGGFNPFENGGSRSNSNVAFGEKSEVIEDSAGDKAWEDRQRHQRRFSRIRNRVPTGHPSLFRLQESSELANIVQEYERSVSSMQTDEETQQNTEANKKA